MSSMYCPHCGKLIEEGDIYCRHCGTKISYPGEVEPSKSVEDDPIDQTFSHMKEIQKQSNLHKERMMEEKGKQQQLKAEREGHGCMVVSVVFIVCVTIFLIILTICDYTYRYR